MARVKRSEGKAHTRIDARRCVLHAAILSISTFMVSLVHSQQDAPCLADTSTAAVGDLGYRSRDGRCEGALQRFVSSQAAISLMGYHRGTIDFSAIRRNSTLPLMVVGAGANGAIALRALSITSQARYQMDTASVELGQPFEWPVELLRKASSLSAAKAADIDALGVIACSARCVDRPDTVYWPVSMATVAAGAQTLAIKLRAGVRSNSVIVSLRPISGSASAHRWPANGVSLTPDGVATIPLPPDLQAGIYELTVEARDAQTLEPLGALYATIVVPLVSR